MSVTFKDIQRNMATFWAERGWLNSDPNQMVTSLLIETGELAEHFQWKSKYPELDETKRQQIAYEIVDILNYLAGITTSCGIEDITPFYEEKMKKLAVKYAVGTDYQTQHDEYRASGKSKNYN